jgi:hypothetical protein
MKEALVARALRFMMLMSGGNELGSSTTAKRIEAEYFGPFKYHVVGRVLTRLADRELEKENAKRRTEQAGIRRSAPTAVQCWLATTNATLVTWK